MSSIIKRIPIATESNQRHNVYKKTIDGTQNTLQNIPTGVYNTAPSVSMATIPLGGNINLQVKVEFQLSTPTLLILSKHYYFCARFT